MSCLRLIIAAILGFFSVSLEAQQTYNEKLRARLDQPLAAPKPLLYWVERLSHSDADVRREAIEFCCYDVGEFGPWSIELSGDWLQLRDARRQQYRSLLPELRKLLRRRDSYQFDEKADASPADIALSILSVIGPDAEAFIPKIKNVILQESIPSMTRMEAFVALLAVTPEDQPVGPLLLRFLDLMSEESKQVFAADNENVKIRNASIGFGVTYYSLLLIKTRHTKSEVPSLVKVALGDYPLEVRATAIGMLGLLSFDAKAAVPGLHKLLKDEDPLIRESAVSSLLMIEDDEALIAEFLPFLMLDEEKRKEYEQELRDYFQEERNDRAELRKSSPAEIDQWLMPETKLILQHGSGFQRRQAIQTLGYIGHKAKDALPALRKALSDPDEDTRRMAAEAIRKIENE